MADHDDDVLLVRECLRGDNNAFCKLVDKYKVPVYNLAYRMLQSEEEAEDAFQEAFFKAYKSLDKYKLKYSFFTWLYTVTLNICRNRLKKKRRYFVFSINEPLSDDNKLTWQIADTDMAPDVLLERRSDMSLINAAVQSLPDKYRAVIILRYLEDMPYQEIAEIVKLPLGTVKTQIHRGRRLMREYIKGERGGTNDV